MFNLEPHNLILLNIGSENVCANATHIAISNSKVFLLKHGIIEVYDAQSGNKIDLSFANELPVFECVTAFTCSSIESKLWFGTGKKIVSVSANNPYDYSILDVEQEFDVAEWDSSYSHLAIIFTNGEIRIYLAGFNSGDLKALHVGHLNDEALDSSSVNVGWGSEKTQFDHSKIKTIESKKTVKEKNKIDVPEEPKYFDDDMKPRLSWKLDSSMFAVNYYANGKRKIKVYHRNCKLHYIYEDLIGLLPFITWHPSYTFISTVAWTNKQCSFLLLGRSTLEKHVFELQIKDNIKEIKWDPVEKHVAIWQCSSDEITTLSLYTFLNYAWNLKQCLRFTPENPLIDFQFVSSFHQCALQIATFKEIVTYYFKYAVHYNRDTDGLTAVVLNGQKLLLSFFKDGAIPSPLYHLMIVTKSPINFVTFHPTKQILAALDFQNILHIYSYCTEFSELLYTFKVPSLDNSNIPLRIRNLCWRTARQIVFLKDESCYNNRIQQVYFLNMVGEPTDWTVERCCLNDHNIQCVYTVRNAEDLIMQSNGEVYLYDLDNKKTIISENIIYRHFDSAIVDSKKIVFGLSDNRLLVNGILLHGYILSFVVHDNYLVLVTCDYQLMVIQFNSAFIQEIHKFRFDFVYTRPIDTGDQLLFAIPNTSNIVMQNKRGNLEVCSCHVMTIDRVKVLIQNNEWLKAVNILRLEKIDYNVLIDLNPDWFLKNIPIFVENIDNVGLLNEIFVSLNDNNVFHTIYKDCGVNSGILESKCNQIFNAMITAMRAYNYIHFIKSIAIAEIMKSTPSVKGALTHIQHLLHISTEEQSFADTAETTILQLQTLKPDLALYKTALSMYDLNLAVYVAVVLCMDPSEYEPFVSLLQKLDECTMRFEINKHIKQFDKGFLYCMRLCSDDEVYEYIVKHDLVMFSYPYLARRNSQLATKVLKLIASKLTSEGKHEEAAVIYLSADLKTDALTEYVAGNFWKQALHLMNELNVISTEKTEYLLKIVKGLTKKGSILDVSYILDKHLNNYEKAIEILIENNMYAVAVALAQDHNRKDIIDADIKLGIENYLNALNDKISNNEKLFNKYKNRLLELRQQKLTIYAQIFDPDFDNQGRPREFDEVGSHIGSIMSAMSTNTSRTGFTVKSTSQRKAERKKDNLREGSHFEDIALMKTLYNLIEETYKYGPEIRSILLTSTAVKHGITSLMVEIHNKLELLQMDMKEAVKDIWPPEIDNIEFCPRVHHLYKNLAEMDNKFRAPPSELDSSWTLKTLVQMSICN